MSLSLGVLVGLGVTDEKVKVSADDTTASYLQSKIAAGSNITLTVLNDGANEQLQITAASGVSPSIGGAITSGTQYAVLFVDPSETFAQDVANFNFNNSTNRLGIGTTASNARVDIKGEGATDATSAIYIANSSSALMFRIKNNGEFTLGLSVSITDNTNVGIGNGGVIATGSGATAIGYGCSATGNGTVAIGNYTTTSSSNDIGIGNANTVSAASIAIGSSITANNASIGIGHGGVSATGSGAVALGYGCTASGNAGISIGNYNTASSSFATSIGNSITNSNQSIAIGRYLTTSASDANVIGSGVYGAPVVNSEANTLLFSFASTQPSIRINKNSNFVLRSNSAITSATHYDANATNVVTIHDGTAPAAAITDACQVFTNADGQLQYMDDSGFTVTL